MTEKRCHSCEAVKPVADFSGDGPGKLKGSCKPCMAARKRARLQDPEKRAKAQAYTKKYLADRPTYSRDWRRSDPVRAQVIRHNSLARSYGVEPELTYDDWRELLEEYDSCAYCHARGVPLEMDHLTPMRRGGRHDRSNIVPVCRPCNPSKGSRTMFEFLSAPARPLGELVAA